MPSLGPDGQSQSPEWAGRESRLALRHLSALDKHQETVTSRPEWGPGWPQGLRVARVTDKWEEEEAGSPDALGWPPECPAVGSA